MRRLPSRGLLFPFPVRFSEEGCLRQTGHDLENRGTVEVPRQPLQQHPTTKKALRSNGRRDRNQEKQP